MTSPSKEQRENAQRHLRERGDQIYTPLEELGQVIHSAWVNWAREQPDFEQNPQWSTPYEKLDRRERDRDIRLGLAVLAWWQVKHSDDPWALNASPMPEIHDEPR